jgi:hypothetical protein
MLPIQLEGSFHLGTLGCWPAGDFGVRATPGHSISWSPASRSTKMETPFQLDSDLEGRLRAAELTYDHVAGTAGVLPAGYYHLHRRTALGLGAARFAETARLLFSW